MNSRILELISAPDSIVEQDLSLLKEEIFIQPYAQSLRALYLLGTKKYDTENFQKVLSTTAAYTTDKKILYQFINGKIYEVKTPESFSIQENISTNNPIINEDSSIQENNLIEAKEELLIIEETAEKINLVESPNSYLSESEIIENPSLIAEQNEVLNIENENASQEIENSNDTKESSENFTSVAEQNEVLNIDKENASQEIENSNDTEEIIEESSSKNENQEVDFYNENSFIPEVIPSNINRQETENHNFIPKKEGVSENKYELERKRLAEEIEQKMALNKKPLDSKPQNSDENHNTTVNFSSTQEFLPNTELQTIENSEEVPAINSSIFAKNLANVNQENNLTEMQEEKTEAISNVPTFINTWQNWLKIDRTSPKITESNVLGKEEAFSNKKAEAIEKFIVTEPKISKLKEDSTFKVQEKKEDINHLMTETLANLFFAQKLYDKATNAFIILKEKHPEKSDYYDLKIEEIEATKLK